MSNEKIKKRKAKLGHCRVLSELKLTQETSDVAFTNFL